MSNLFEVYGLLDVEPVKAQGSLLWDANGTEYFDFYGGHAVISIGHSHPHYVKRISEQLNKIGFYSNAVKNPLQVELAELLCKTAGYPDYKLFLCNSGAEANENAMKLASFETGRDAVLVMKSAFHGRTSQAVAATDNPKIQAPVNKTQKVTFIPMNDVAVLEEELRKQCYAAVLIEGIQGVGGIQVPNDDYLLKMRELCDETGTMLILDEIQSGYGRTGLFFAHQQSGVKPDMITMAKGIGNGFPMAGVLIKPEIEAKKGMLGTTFGGSHLACAAALAVLEVMNSQNLVQNAAEQGAYLMSELSKESRIVEMRGRGLMIGIDLPMPQSEFRSVLLNEYRVLTGMAGTHTLRLLPALTITREECDRFLEAFRGTMKRF